ncbi:MAG: hypothetical protein HQM09_14560 [Candidatus Riflebacteria bacterium]|nr:hypothetical protein [Candidatus Riflebacteria bacterium]
MQWSRGEYAPANEDKAELFHEHPELISEYARLEKKFRLDKFRDNSSLMEFRESMYVLSLLEQAFPASLPGKSLRALDIGSKNFAYVRGLYHFFQYAPSARQDRTEKENIRKNACKIETEGEDGTEPAASDLAAPRSIFLTGIEIDPFPVYADTYSRSDYARYHVKRLSNCRYIAGDLMEHHERYDVITWFLPFLTEDAIREWGLPSRFLRPEELMKHAFELMEPGGIMLVVNQEEDERDIQHALLKKMQISIMSSTMFKSDWYPFLPRFVTIIIKSFLQRS